MTQEQITRIIEERILDDWYRGCIERDRKRARLIAHQAAVANAMRREALTGEPF